MAKTKISWIKARELYAHDETQSYASIAKKFGVAKHTVEWRAKRENWQEYRRESLAKLGQSIGETLENQKLEAISEMIKTGEILQRIGRGRLNAYAKQLEKKSESIDQISLAEARKYLVAGIRLKATALGIETPSMGDI